jgi:TIR domain
MPTFISHDMEDKAEYARLVDVLNHAGVEHWGPKSMMPGVSLRQQLIEGIGRCGSCVFLATRNPVQSRWCGAELGALR